MTFIESFRGSIIAHWKYVFVISNGLFHRTSFYFLVWEILLIEALQVFATIRLHIPWVSTNIFSFIKLLHNKLHISMKISLWYLSYYMTNSIYQWKYLSISKMGFSQNFIRFLVWEILSIETLQVFDTRRPHVLWVLVDIFSLLRLLQNKIHIPMERAIRFHKWVFNGIWFPSM